MARTSFTLVMLSIAAAVSLALGVVGIYGVISYVVSRRTREIGVRMALGADRRDVSWMVLRQGMILTSIGVVVGLVAAVGLTRLMSSLLYGVEATDPVTFGVVVAVLVAVALIASYLPALRASRTDPLEALGSSRDSGGGARVGGGLVLPVCYSDHRVVDLPPGTAAVLVPSSRSVGHPVD